MPLCKNVRVSATSRFTPRTFWTVSLAAAVVLGAIVAIPQLLSKQARLEVLRSHVGAIARLAASVVDGDLHRQLLDPANKTPELYARFPGRDWILTRILWLSGREPGRNRWGDVDTMRRYIYIHGTHEYAELGKPGSIGCVRMANRDILELFEMVLPGTPVEIRE